MNDVIGDPIFRGSQLGDPYDKVMNSENSEFLVFADTNMLKYVYSVSDSEEYHWAYVFDEDKLSEIQFDAYLGQVSNGKQYFNLIQKKYDKEFGPSKVLPSIASWKNSELQVDLLDESPIVLMGKVKMFFSLVADSSIKRNIPER